MASYCKNQAVVMWRSRCWSVWLCPVHFLRNWQKTITNKCWQTVITTERPLSSGVLFLLPSFHRFLHSRSLALGCVVVSVARSSSCLWAAVFSATSGREEGLSVGIFSDANCFRSSSVAQSRFGKLKWNQLLAVKHHFTVFQGIFRACEVRLAASEGFWWNLNAVKI